MIVPSRNAEGPVFGSAYLLIPSISLAYGVGYGLEVIQRVGPHEVICSTGSYLVKFVENEREFVEVYSNVMQSIQGGEHTPHTNIKTAVWERQTYIQGSEFRDIIEALVAHMGEACYG